MVARRRQAQAARCSPVGRSLFGLSLAVILGVHALACVRITQHPDGDSTSPVETNPSSTGDHYPGVSLAFTESDLELAPGKTRSIEIVASPPGVYPVRVALFGDTEGAYVDQSEVMTDESGHGSLQLTVPMASERFRVRASLGDAYSELLVHVAPDARAVLLITPQYTGKRPIEAWSVAILPNTICAGLDLYSLTNYSDPPTRHTPVKVDVDANQPLAVALRGDETVSGCRETSVAPGNPTKIDLQVLERSIQFSTLDAQILIGFDPKTAFAPTLEALAAKMGKAFRDGFDRDVDAVLAEMAELSANQSAFSSASASEDWTGQLVTRLTEPGAQTGLTSYVMAWLQTGLQSLFQGHAIVGTISGAIPPASRAVLHVSSVVDQNPRDVGIPDYFVVGVAPTGEDNVRLVFEFAWQPARLLARLADVAALAQTPADAGTVTSGSDAGKAGTAVDVLASDILQCPSLGSLLAGADGIAFEGCDQYCLADLCTSALDRMWQRLQSVDTTPASIQITSDYQKVSIDRAARPIGFHGHWGGNARFDDTEPIDVGGDLRVGP